MDVLLTKAFTKKYSVSEQLLMLHLLLMANNKGIVSVSVRSLSDEIGMSYQTTRTTIKKLIEKKELNTDSNASSNAKKTTLSISSYGSFAVIANADDNAQSNAIFEEVWLAYNRKGSKKKSLEQWLKLTDEERNKILPHVKAYVSSRERIYQKDFERYLRDKVFNEVVVKGNDTIYDPEHFKNKNEYRPTTDGIFQYWNDNRKCLMFNGYIDQLNDGYSDEERPDGAKVAWGMYEWVWSSRTKEWVKQND